MIFKPYITSECHAIPVQMIARKIRKEKDFLSSVWASLQNCEKGVLSSSCLSVRPSAWNDSAPTGPIFMKFDV